MKAKTIEDIRGLAKAEADEFDSWPEQDEKGRDTIPPASYWDALDALMAGYDPRVMPKAQREMRALDEAYRDLDVSTDGNAVPMYFRNARDSAQRAIAAEPIERVHPLPAEMAAQGVRPWQIAYDWAIFQAGTHEPDIPAIEQELRVPGSVLTPERIAHRRHIDLIGQGFILADGEEPEPWKPESIQSAYPPIEIMLREGVSLEQVAALKSKEFGLDNTADIMGLGEMVAMLAKFMGLHNPINSREVLNEAGRKDSVLKLGAVVVDSPIQHVPIMEESSVVLEDVMGDDVEVLEQDQTLDRDARVCAAFSAGQDSSTIARTEGLTTKEVKAILRSKQRELTG